MIGQDFEKISFDFLGLELLEPNAFIGDLIIAILSFLFAHKTYKIYKRTLSNNHKYWLLFFLVFGIGFLAGGLGHLLFNYWGIPGKFVSWYSGVVFPFLIEMAMFSLLKEKEMLFKLLAKIKLVIGLIILTLIIIKYDLNKDMTKGMIVPTYSSLIGLFFALGYLGYVFSIKMHKSFNLLWISILVMLPSVFFQSMKINLHPWFDRNDVGHFLLIINIILYFSSIVKYDKYKTSLLN